MSSKEEMEEKNGGTHSDNENEAKEPTTSSGGKKGIHSVKEDEGKELNSSLEKIPSPNNNSETTPSLDGNEYSVESTLMSPRKERRIEEKGTPSDKEDKAKQSESSTGKIPSQNDCSESTPVFGGAQSAIEDSSDESEDGGSNAKGIPEFIPNDLLECLSIGDDKILEKTSLGGIAKYIKEHPNLKIITMVGAGISTAAGIPDFRSPRTGIYNNLQKYNLPHNNAIFELDYFLSNPEPFYQLASEIFPGSYKPTIAHYFIKLLQEKNLLLRHFTQNIDNLERICGIRDDKLIEAHGTFNTSHCTNVECKMLYSLEWLKEKIKDKVIPKCAKCEALVKPDIVFFGESLPKKFYEHLSDFRRCDLLIIMGSSLAVEPFASLCTRVRDDIPRLMINSYPAGTRLGLLFMVPKNGRDVLWLGECNKGCEKLAEKLGWKEELHRLMEKDSNPVAQAE